MYCFRCEVCGEKFKSEFPKAYCNNCDMIIEGSPSVAPIIIFASVIVAICAGLVIIGRLM